jgi:uncharacterized membrane protein YqjE
MEHATATRNGHSQRDGSDQSLAELVKSLSEQSSQLVRDEMRLAAAELKQKGKRAGAGAGLFGGAAVLGLYAGGALVTCLIAALGKGMDLWAAALIVSGGLFALAALAGLLAKRQVAQALPPAPQRALDGLHRDVATVKEHLR